MWAHVPHTRLHDEQPVSQSNHLSIQPLPSSSHSNSPSNKSPIERARFCAIFARVNRVSPLTQKPLHIPINNSFPSVVLHLGSVEDEESQMHMLLDTGVTMNLGSITYHLWVMSQCPEMSGGFIQYGDGTGYNVVQLLAALNLVSSDQLLDHGKMTSVIRYKTPYLTNKRDPLFIYLALGNDVSFRCVLGLPTLLAVGGLIDLVKGGLICSEINQNVSLTLDPSCKGLPEGIVFDNSTLIIPQGMSTNIKHTPSLLHYTSAEGRAFHCSSLTYSENIVVHDNFFNWNQSRDLEYKPN